MRSLSALFAVLGVTLVAACGSDSTSRGSGDPELTAVATTTQLGDMVGQVGGERVAVEQILEPNADPHDYEPRPSDAQALADAGVVFKSGGDLDEWLDELVESAGSDAEVIEALAAVRTIDGEGHEHEDEEHAEGEEGHTGEDEHADEDDPHWWQDPRNAGRVVEMIRDALVEADPEGREAYETNASDYLDRLEQLDRTVAGCIAEIPRDQRQLVTTHDALGYYADRYGLEIVGTVIPSLSTQAQPSAGDTADLVEEIERLDVAAIFPESSLSPDVERAIAREAGADVGGALWADTLGPENSSGATYVESIEANTATIADGLSGGEATCELGG